MRETDRLGAVEALLFVSSAPVTGQQVAEALEGEVDPAEASALLATLQERFERESSGLRVERVAEGFRLVTRPAHAPFVRNFLKAQNLRKLTAASVEALAIVAYKQPVTTPEVSAIRGTESGSVLKGLLDKKLIRIAGRRNVVGKPLLYGTTKDFLVHFGLNSLEDLPSFREIEEVFRDNVRQESLFRETEESPSGGPGVQALSGDVPAGDIPADDLPDEPGGEEGPAAEPREGDGGGAAEEHDEEASHVE